MADASASSDGGWVHNTSGCCSYVCCFVFAVRSLFHHHNFHPVFIVSVIWFMTCFRVTCCSCSCFNTVASRQSRLPLCHAWAPNLGGSASWARAVLVLADHVTRHRLMAQGSAASRPSVDGSRFPVTPHTRTHAIHQTQQFKWLRFTWLPARRGSSAKAVGALRAVVGANGNG